MNNKMKHILFGAIILVIANTVGHADHKNKPKYISLFNMNYPGAIGAVWVDDGSRMLVSSSAGTYLIDVGSGTSEKRTDIPQFLGAIPCNDGNAVLLQTSSSVWLIDTKTWVKQQLDVASCSTSIEAINSEGKQVIINSPAGSSVYNLENGTLLTRIPAKMGFSATDFISESQNTFIGDLDHYGLVKWDTKKNDMVEIIKPYQSPEISFAQALEGSNDEMQSIHHLRFVCKPDRNGQVMIDRKEHTSLRFPYLKSDDSVTPNASGTRLIVVNKANISVVDINSGKTIYVWKQKP